MWICDNRWWGKAVCAIMMWLCAISCAINKCQMHTSDKLNKWIHSIEQVLDRIGEKRTFLNNILRRKANWIRHILRRNYLLHDAIEGQMTEVKGVWRRRTQLLDDLRNRRRYWELNKSVTKIEVNKRTILDLHFNLDLALGWSQVGRTLIGKTGNSD